MKIFANVSLLFIETWKITVFNMTLLFAQNFQIHKFLNQKRLGCQVVNVMLADRYFVVDIKECKYPGVIQNVCLIEASNF